MKKIILGTVVCLGAFAFMGTGTASAAMLDQLTVNLPYDASVGGVTLPAGEYTIRDLQDDGNSSVLQISAYNGKSVAAMAMQVVAPKHSGMDKSKVILQQTEEGYRIQSIWLAGQEIGLEFLPATR